MVNKGKKKTKKKKKRKWKENQFIVLNFALLLKFLSLFLVTNSTIFFLKKSPKLPKDSKTSNLFCQISSMPWLK